MEDALEPERGDDCLEGEGVCALDVNRVGDACEARGQGEE